MKNKTFTENQKARLPEEGYWLELNTLSSRPTAVCIKNGKVKYIHYDWGESWCTLLWSCCFTKKQIAQTPEKYRHYKTIQELIQDNPNLPLVYHTIAPNDF